MREIIVSANDGGQRLDRFLKKYLRNAPLSLVYKVIRKDLKLNGKRAKEETVLTEGDVLAVYMREDELKAFTERSRQSSAKRQFSAVYEDENILVADKPFGLLVHGDSAEKKDTLANQVVDYLIEKGDYVPRLERSFVPSPVHRLDRNTTGLVVFGKNSAALRVLSAALAKDMGFTKYYYAISCGELKEELHLKNRLVKDEKNNKVRVLASGSAQGKYIETVVHPMYAGGGFSLVLVELVTGRSHQIRAHLRYAGFPLIGDAKYGDAAVNGMLKRKLGLSTQLLHAGKLVFRDMDEPLAYLEGTEAVAPLPPRWKGIQTELFGKEIFL